MGSSHSSTASRLLALFFRTIFWAVSGSLLIALVVAGIRWNQVRAAEQEARLLMNAWRFNEAESRLKEAENWSRCFPGFYAENVLIRIEIRTRQNQWREAWPLAEAIRLHLDKPIAFPSLSSFVTTPLLSLHRFGLAIISRISLKLHPPRTTNAWAGYEAILTELQNQQNDDELNAFQEAINLHFPRSPIAVQTAAAPRMADRQPRRRNPLPPASSPSTTATERVRVRPSPPPKETEPISTQETPIATEPPAPARWGLVTNREAFAYHPRTSAPARPLQAGDVVALERFFTLRNLEAAEGTLILTNGTIPELAFLIKDLEIRPGAYQDADPHEVMWRSRLARLLAEEASLRVQLERTRSGRKPEEAAYEDALRRYEDLQNRARALQAQLDNPRADRTKILEQLRTMRYQEAALEREVRACKERLDRVGGSPAKRIEEELHRLAREIEQARQALSKWTSS